MWKWWKMKEYGENGLGLRAVAHGGAIARGAARRGGATTRVARTRAWKRVAH